MIKLTDSIGKPIYISPEKVVAVALKKDGETAIDTASETYYVADAPEEVVKKILLYKLGLHDWSEEANEDITELAGL